MRGTYLLTLTILALSDELSPRAWGVQAPFGESFGVRRAIPTCVGLTLTLRCARPGGRSYPHVRGAYPLWGPTEAVYGEPSPRAWGLPSAGASGF